MSKANRTRISQMLVNHQHQRRMMQLKGKGNIEKQLTQPLSPVEELSVFLELQIPRMQINPGRGNVNVFQQTMSHK